MAPLPAQSYVTTFAPRLRYGSNSVIQPILQTQAVQTTGRSKRTVNYADDLYDDDDFDDSEGPRRPTGLRSLRREDLEKKEPQHEKVGQELYNPIDMQYIYRNWITDGFKQRRASTLQGNHAQAQFPLTLIPIRIDYEVQPHQQDAPFPVPPRAIEMGVNLAQPAYKRPEPSPGYKIRDVFLWNLHEALFTPEDFAVSFVQDLDLPNSNMAIMEISKQIRSQLEDYAGVALHPLFHTSPKRAIEAAVRTEGNAQASSVVHNGFSQAGTPGPNTGNATPLAASGTPAPNTPADSTPQPGTLPNGATISAHASPLPSDVQGPPNVPQEDVILNLDDTYRCVITLSIYLSSRLYQDKFEWSLLHPPGAAEAFAKQTCADMGLNGEWVSAITHAIYEAVLRLKKETCEGGGMIAGGGIWGRGEIDNQAVRVVEGAGWRYDDADFGAEWEPKLEALSKEEIEKREGDRERQLRRLRRETARFTSTAGMTPTAREQEAQQRGSYFDMPGLGNGGDEPLLMGRGERNRKKRRLRSPSPSGKASTPTEPADAGWGGERNKLQEYERQNWRCSHCQVWGSAVWAVRDGPKGPRTLCNNCGLLYERDKQLPAWSLDLHKGRPRMPIGR